VHATADFWVSYTRNQTRDFGLLLWQRLFSATLLLALKQSATSGLVLATATRTSMESLADPFFPAQYQVWTRARGVLSACSIGAGVRGPVPQAGSKLYAGAITSAILPLAFTSRLLLSSRFLSLACSSPLRSCLSLSSVWLLCSQMFQAAAFAFVVIGAVLPRPAAPDANQPRLSLRRVALTMVAAHVWGMVLLVCACAIVPARPLECCVHLQSSLLSPEEQLRHFPAPRCYPHLAPQCSLALVLLVLSMVVFAVVEARPALHPRWLVRRRSVARGPLIAF
jgi:hypothetical protein